MSYHSMNERLVPGLPSTHSHGGQFGVFGEFSGATKYRSSKRALSSRFVCAILSAIVILVIVGVIAYRVKNNRASSHNNFKTHKLQKGTDSESTTKDSESMSSSRIPRYHGDDDEQGDVYDTTTYPGDTPQEEEELPSPSPSPTKITPSFAHVPEKYIVHVLQSINSMRVVLAREEVTRSDFESMVGDIEKCEREVEGSSTLSPSDAAVVAKVHAAYASVLATFPDGLDALDSHTNMEAWAAFSNAVNACIEICHEVILFLGTDRLSSVPDEVTRVMLAVNFLRLHNSLLETVSAPDHTVFTEVRLWSTVINSLLRSFRPTSPQLAFAQKIQSVFHDLSELCNSLPLGTRIQDSPAWSVFSPLFDSFISLIRAGAVELLGCGVHLRPSQVDPGSLYADAQPIPVEFVLRVLKGYQMVYAASVQKAGDRDALVQALTHLGDPRTSATLLASDAALINKIVGPAKQIVEFITNGNFGATLAGFPRPAGFMELYENIDDLCAAVGTRFQDGVSQAESLPDDAFVVLMIRFGNMLIREAASKNASIVTSLQHALKELDMIMTSKVLNPGQKAFYLPAVTKFRDFLGKLSSTPSVKSMSFYEVERMGRSFVSVYSEFYSPIA